MPITVLQKPLAVYSYFRTTGFIFLLVIGCGYAAQGQSPAQQQETPAKNQSQPPVTAVSPSPSQAAVEQPQGRIEAKERKDQPAAFWDAKLTDWIQVGINVVLLLVVFWQARINRDQRITMQKQSDIMQGELETTKKALEHSERALLASESQAETAKQSVQIAKDSFYIGERPYFGITKIELQIAGRLPRVDITFQNGGKTPAWRFYAHVLLVLGDDPLSNNRRLLNSKEPAYNLRYFPVGQTHEFVFAKIGTQLNELEMDDLRNEITLAFVVVTAEFMDIRGEKLSQNFTGIWDIKTNTLSDWEQ